MVAVTLEPPLVTTPPILVPTTPRLRPILRRPQILEIIHHERTALWVDGITELTPRRVIGYRRITERDCKGHFGIFQGFRQLEVAGQVGSVCVLSLEQNRGKIAIFDASFGGRFFRHPVRVGDIFIIEVRVRFYGKKEGVASSKGYVFKDGKQVGVHEFRGRFRVTTREALVRAGRLGV